MNSSALRFSIKFIERGIEGVYFLAFICGRFSIENKFVFKLSFIMIPESKISRIFDSLLVLQQKSVMYPKASLLNYSSALNDNIGASGSFPTSYGLLIKSLISMIPLI